MNQPMHVLLHPDDIAIMRAIPELAEVVQRYDEGVANLDAYAPQIEEARGIYTMSSDNNLEIDDNPMLSPGDDGTWVSAWVWVPMPEDEEDEEDEE